MMKCELPLFLLLTAAILTEPLIGQVDEDGRFVVDSNLRAGTAKLDITPQEVEDYEVIGHRRKVTGVRDPFRAGGRIGPGTDSRGNRRSWGEHHGHGITQSLRAEF